MLTGDSSAAAGAVAQGMGIRNVQAGTLPGQKGKRVQALQVGRKGGREGGKEEAKEKAVPYSPGIQFPFLCRDISEEVERRPATNALMPSIPFSLGTRPPRLHGGRRDQRLAGLGPGGCWGGDRGGDAGR